MKKLDLSNPVCFRDYIKEHHLFDSDISRLYVVPTQSDLNPYGDYEIVIMSEACVYQILHTGHNIFDDYNNAIREFPGEIARRKDFFRSFVDLLKNITHPYQDDLDNFLKPTSLMDLHAFILQYGAPTAIGNVAGPDGKDDVLLGGQALSLHSLHGKYIAPQRDPLYPRSMFQSVIFIPWDNDAPHLMNEDVLDYAQNDLVFCRKFSLSLAQVHEPFFNYVQILKDQASSFPQHLKKMQEKSPWNPLYRLPMQEFAGASGLIPYSELPPDAFALTSGITINKAFEYAGFHLDDDEKRSISIHSQEGLLDDYEIRAVLASRNHSFLTTMIERNNEFYALKRDTIKSDTIDYTRYTSIPPEDLQKLEDLHCEGFATEDDIAGINANYARIKKHYSSLNQKQIDASIASLESIRDFFGRGRGVSR